MNLPFCTMCSHPALLCIIVNTRKWWIFRFQHFNLKGGVTPCFNVYHYCTNSFNLAYISCI